MLFVFVFDNRLNELNNDVLRSYHLTKCQLLNTLYLHTLETTEIVDIQSIDIFYL